jgi:ABC-type dipeptide/oligopeptide/nickel transport system permease component
VIGFGLLRLSGDLAQQLAGDDARPAQIAEVARRYGLDRPFYVQYVDWAGNALSGNLGRSLFTNEPVAQLIGERIGVTLKLAVLSVMFAFLVAVPLGVLAAVRANSFIDRAALTVAVFGQAIPNFWFGLILIVVFGVTLRWLPISGSDTLANFVLPTVTLGFTVMPPFMRLTRSGMLDVLHADYIRTARAKGLLPTTVIFKHALRNAILPIVSLLAVTFGFLLGGSVIVESVFALNGIGLLAFQSIVRADFPVVQAIIVFVSFAYIGLTLLADIVNAWLDPRIRLR